MSFLSRWFSPATPLDDLRKAFRQERWADVVTISSEMDEDSLGTADRAELKELVDRAANSLSRINYDEALALFRTDDIRRGMEHLDLACQLVRSDELRELIDAEFIRIGRHSECLSTNDPKSIPAPVVNHGCSSSCCGSGGGEAPGFSGSTGEFDEETRFDLVLTAYPVDIRPRYLELSTNLRQAILMAHEDREEMALSLFSQAPESERNDLYYYEVGALHARRNQYHDAVAALQESVSLNPSFLLPLITLVDLHFANRNYGAAHNLLGQMLQINILPEFCHARLASFFLVQGDGAEAFDHASKALALGYNDPELMVFIAKTLESQGKISEAEGVLSAIPVGGGCSGGANVELAEFWLRHKKDLHKSLEIFKKAAKGDPANPLWGYHIARVYLALGWTKEGKEILQAFANADTLDSTLRENVTQLLNQY